MWELDGDSGSGEANPGLLKRYKRILGLSYREHKTNYNVWQQRKDLVIIQEDWNAKVSPQWAGTAGRCGAVEPTNERGERLLEFAHRRKMALVNILFAFFPRAIQKQNVALARWRRTQPDWPRYANLYIYIYIWHFAKFQGKKVRANFPFHMP